MSSWTPEQLDALNAEAEHKQRMEDAGVDPGIPAEREAWEAGTTGGHSPSDWHASLPYEDGETPYARWLREMQLMELAGIDPANAPLREAWQQAMAAPANATLDLAEYPPWELDPSWHPDASHLVPAYSGQPTMRPPQEWLDDPLIPNGRVAPPLVTAAASAGPAVRPAPSVRLVPAGPRTPGRHRKTR